MPAGGEAFERRGHLVFHRRGRMRRVLDFERVLTSCRPKHGQRLRGAKVLRDRRRVQRGGHDDDLEIRPARPLQAPQQGQREIAFEMALVEFVEHHAPHAREVGIAQHAACEHALGQEAQARTGPGDFFEAHLIADCLADGLAALGCDIARRQTRGQTARFQHQHLACGELEQCGRHARGLSRAGRRFQHEMVGGAQVVQDFAGAARRWGGARELLLSQFATMFWRMISACG